MWIDRSPRSNRVHHFSHVVRIGADRSYQAAVSQAHKDEQKQCGREEQPACQIKLARIDHTNKSAGRGSASPLGVRPLTLAPNIQRFTRRLEWLEAAYPA